MATKGDDVKMVLRSKRLLLLYTKLNSELENVKKEEKDLRLKISKAVDEHKKKHILNFIAKKA